MNILVTGGSGFIGSHFIEEIIKRDDVIKVYNVDCDTYAANKKLPFQTDSKYQKLTLDITAPYFSDQKKYLESLNLDYVVHFAAESHVDNSIKGPKKFIETNIIGTFNLLETFKGTNIKKFIHVSTDEVFGSLSYKESEFNVDSPYRPNSPYAASKAASDLLVRSYVKTYQFPGIITNCSNNFGPRQFPEKLIPLTINKLKNKESIPLYGTGDNIRDWIYVKDHVNALINVLLDGKAGKQYLIGGENEMSNIQLITILKDVYSKVADVTVDWEWYKCVEDRKGHDFRYAIDTFEFKNEFPQFKLTPYNQSIEETVKSYIS
jgi:dTDP-glucose 4,6-dehydratase